MDNTEIYLIFALHLNIAMGRNTPNNRKAASDKIAAKKKKEQAKEQTRQAALKAILQKANISKNTEDSDT